MASDKMMEVLGRLEANVGNIKEQMNSFAKKEDIQKIGVSLGAKIDQNTRKIENLYNLREKDNNILPRIVEEIVERSLQHENDP